MYCFKCNFGTEQINEQGYVRCVVLGFSVPIKGTLNASAKQMLWEQSGDGPFVSKITEHQLHENMEEQVWGGGA